MSQSANEETANENTAVEEVNNTKNQPTDREINESDSSDTTTGTIKVAQDVNTDATLNPEQIAAATRHWNILRDAVLGENFSRRSSTSDSNSFKVLTKHTLDERTAAELSHMAAPEMVREYRIHIKGVATPHSVYVFHHERSLRFKDIQDTNDDNTGRIKLWPSEEALATYVLEHTEYFRGKQVLELGGGYSCLAGLMAAKYAKADKVVLTDGNEACTLELAKTLALNTWPTDVTCERLRWENAANSFPNSVEQYDVVMAADCIFFADQQQPLVEAICHFLKPDSEALMMAPQRDTGYEHFIEKCKSKGLMVEQQENYSQTIWDLHQSLLLENKKYSEKTSYPQLLRIYKPLSMIKRSSMDTILQTEKEAVNF